jgi:hypothetical protein
MLARIVPFGKAYRQGDVQYARVAKSADARDLKSSHMRMQAYASFLTLAQGVEKQEAARCID